MPGSESDAFVSDNEEEVKPVQRFDNYAPPSERRKTRVSSVKRTPRKLKKAETKPKVVKNAAKMVIGLDFGTTYSGLAFTWSNNPKEITPLMDVDDSNNDDPKIPSSIYYDGEQVVWGNAAQEELEAVQWFKLLLLDEVQLPQEIRESQHIQKARAQLREMDMTAEEVVSDYICSFWNSSMDKLKTAVGQATGTSSRFHVVITVPAIWPDSARQRMENAVKNAGILDKRSGVGNTVVTYVSEPEAAALATLKGVDGRSDIHEGDFFVVCDAGGGTVDIISYIVKGPSPCLSGKLWEETAIFVDDEFKLLLKEKLSEIAADAWDTIYPEELKSIMTNDWPKIRKMFTGNPSRSWTTRVPYSLVQRNPQAREPMFKITGSEIERVFKPVVQRIGSLVRKQFDAIMEKEGKPPKYIMLVGGFGRCKYLRTYLSTLFPDFPDLEILQSQNSEPWTAICRGAVIHGLTLEKPNPRFTVEVVSRISRASSGVTCQEKFDPTKHLDEDKVFDEEQQDTKATNQMKWLIEEGEDIMVNRKFREEFFKIVTREELENEDLSTVIWMSKKSPPPPPPSRRDDTVIEYLEVKWHAKIDADRLPIFVNNQQDEYYKLKFVAEMKRSGGCTELAIFHNGKRVAAKNVSVAFYDDL